MDTNKLKKFAQAARRQLREEVATRLEVVLNTDSAELREYEKALTSLKTQISETSKEAVIARVAYTWFNRFCALRFMDANRYTRIGVVSPAKGFTQPEILAEAKQGHIDEELNRYLNRQKVFDLLAGRLPSKDPQNEAYRMLLVAMCNYYNASMPFLFSKIADYTQLLMPVDLLSEAAVLNSVREALTDETCEDVEVIGWLYQFYISEKKDEVFEGLKKNQKITPENIPAATQLFTPHWIVKYLVENSLGRLWMLNRPDSGLVDKMEYYIRPDTSGQLSGISDQQEVISDQPSVGSSQQEANTDNCTLNTDYLRISSPEDIKICDPACGSGHMLVYAFDLLYAIYEEEGYEPTEIPQKILTHNLYGIEIDERAGELAAFALTMKARSKDRRFFNRGILPHICVLENVRFDAGELKTYMDEIGRDLFTANFQTTLHQFEEADNFGSLIRPAFTDTHFILQRIKEKDISGNLFLFQTHQKVLKVLKQTDYLSPKYHVVVANPPYMGRGGMNGRLGSWAKGNYPDSKLDLFSMFIERILLMIDTGGYAGLMTPFTWMFLSSYEKLRLHLFKNNTLTSLVRPEYHAFFESAYVPICGFTLFKYSLAEFKGTFIDLQKFYGPDIQSQKLLEAINNPLCGWSYYASVSDFNKIPGSPIAYWVSEALKKVFDQGQPLSSSYDVKKGADTGNNDLFLRFWHEVSFEQIGGDRRKWVHYNKGGAFRKWYGNYDYIIYWENDGYDLKHSKANLRSQHLYFRPSLTWSALTSSKFSIRYSDKPTIFDSAGSSLFSDSDIFLILEYLNTPIVQKILDILNPTLNYGAGTIGNIPFLNEPSRNKHAVNLIRTSIIDWNYYETSIDFTHLPLLRSNHRQRSVKATYESVRSQWRVLTLEMQCLEQENNRIFIDAYGLQDELTPEVPLSEITLTCNPYYRYGGNKSEEELETLLLADTMREFISYAVGCMFGRYSLDAPGLILANQGEGIDDYLRIIQEKRERPDSHQSSAVSNQKNPSNGSEKAENCKLTTDSFPENCKLTTDSSESGFKPDSDNVIPLLDGDWFTDDISERFKKFLRITFGEDHYEENLKFIEDAIGKDIRKFFLKDFYNDHIRRYKKRPIYWLFSSPKGSFNAIIYMHRYRPDTVSVVLNDYLREFRTKLGARKTHLEQVSISGSASQAEKTKALKEIESFKKMIAELEDYEREVIYPLAAKQVEINLDDGVVVNYNKFGNALKKVAGLN